MKSIHIFFLSRFRFLCSIFLFYRSISLFHSFRCYCGMVTRNQRNRIFVLQMKWNDSTAPYIYILYSPWWWMVECLRRRSASIDGDMMAKVEKSQKESLRLSIRETKCFVSTMMARCSRWRWSLNFKSIRSIQCSSRQRSRRPGIRQRITNNFCHLYPHAWASQFVFHFSATTNALHTTGNVKYNLSFSDVDAEWESDCHLRQHR